MSKTEEKEYPSISETLFGLDRDHASKLAKSVKKIMKEHSESDAPDEEEDVDHQELIDHWQKMYGDIVSMGVTENERLWLTFTFATHFVQAHQNNEVHNQMKKLLKKLSKHL